MRRYVNIGGERSRRGMGAIFEPLKFNEMKRYFIDTKGVCVIFENTEFNEGRLKLYKGWQRINGIVEPLTVSNLWFLENTTNEVTKDVAEEIDKELVEFCETKTARR